MIRGSELLDLPIYECSIKKKTANIKSFLLNVYTKKIEALLVKRNMLSNNIYFIPTYKILRIDNDKILVSYSYEVKDYPVYTDDSLQYADYRQIVNKIIVDFDNNILGIIRDIWIDEINWDFIAYEISEGYIDDFLTGRKIMFSKQKYRIEGNYVCLYGNNTITSYDDFFIEN